MEPASVEAIVTESTPEVVREGNENGTEEKSETSTEPVLTETVADRIELKTEETTEASSTNWARQVSNEEEQKLKEAEELKQAQEASSVMANTNQDKGKKKGRKKKEIDPAQIPRKGYFFEHDNREDEVDDENESDKDKIKNAENTATVPPESKEEPNSNEPVQETENPGEKAVESKENAQLDNATNSKKPSMPKNSARTKVNLNNINQKYGNKVRANSGKTNFRKKKQIEDEDSIDDDAKWSHDRFDSNEQQPKTKIELVKRYGYDIREKTDKNNVEKLDASESLVANEKKSVSSKNTNRRKADSANSTKSEPVKDSNVKPTLQMRLDFSSKNQQSNAASSPHMTRSFPHQKDRIISNSNRRNVNSSNTSEARKDFNKDARRTKSNQNQIDLNNYHNNKNNNDDDQFYDDEDEEENDEHERLNLMRKNNGDNENDNFIGNIYNLEGHSSLSIFFIPSDFHDLHHTGFTGNYGIHGFWDRIFNTLNPLNKKQGIMFPVSFIEYKTMKLFSSVEKDKM